MGNVDRLFNILVAAVTEAASGYVTGGVVTAVVAAKEFTGGVLDWLSKREKIEPFASRAIENFNVWADKLSLDDEVSLDGDARETAVREASDLFLKAGITPQQFARVDFDPEKVTEIAIGFESVSDATRHMLFCMYDWLLRDPDFREDFRMVFEQVSLSRSSLHKKAIAEVGSDVKHIMQSLPKYGPLFKEPKKWLPKNGPSALLNSDYRVVPFWGRQKETDDLQQWCAHDAEFGIRLYTGPGGMGKTRLLMEMVEQQRAQGWLAGFIDKDADEQTLKLAAKKFLNPDTPTLLVIDYAETRPALVTTLIQATEKCSVFRLVLLARSKGDWWDQLLEDRRCDGILSNPDVVAHILLTPLAGSPEERSNIFKAACGAFAQTLDKPVPAENLPKPEDDMYQRVLYIHLAAMMAVHGVAPVANANALLTYIVLREHSFLSDKCGAPGRKKIDRKTIIQAAAMATLAGTMDMQQAKAMLGRCPRLQGKDIDVIEDVAAILHETYPGAGYISGVQPDIVGEHLVATAIENDQSLLDAFFGHEDDSPEYQGCIEHGLTVLTRLAQRDDTRNKHLSYVFKNYLQLLYKPAMLVAVWQGDPVGKLMAEALKDTEDVQLIQNIIFHTSGLGKETEQSIHLLEFHYEAYKLAITHWRQTPDGDLFQQKLRADLLNNFSIYLHDRGMCKEALTFIEEAITQGQKLVSANPNLYSPGLANYYDTLAILLTKLNRLSEAEKISRNVVNTKEKFITNPKHYLQLGYNTSLGNLIVILRGRQKYDEALSKSEELLHIERQIYHLTDGETKPALAGSLTNHGTILREVGRAQEAYDISFKALRLYRELAETRPDIYLPYLATALNNIAAILSNLNRYKEAIDAVQEAIEIYLPLAKQRNEIFTPKLAQSISTKAAVFYLLEEHKNALPLYHEAIKLLFPFFSHSPEEYNFLIHHICGEYVRICELTSTQLDTDLLNSIIEISNTP